MNKTSLVQAALAVAGFVALAGCSSGASHPMTSNGGSTPAATMAPAPVAATTPEVSPRLIRQIQTTLKQQGLYKGRVDGVWGAQTQAAIHGYQQAHSLADTGELDTPTLAALKTASGGGEKQVPVAMAPATPPAATTANPAPPATPIVK